MSEDRFLCEMCRAPIAPRARRWCGKKCSDRWRWSVPSEPFDCPGCGKTVLVPAGKKAKRRYCTLSCARATYNRTHLRAERNGRWRGGKVMSYGPEWRRIKAEVRARDGVCRECGKTSSENGRALDVHHLDPFRFSGDNSPKNLVTLCRSCHMQADDHGRRGNERFLKHTAPRRPTKRTLRALRARMRAADARARRGSSQREAQRLHAEGAGLREMSGALGVSHQTVANWANGKHRARERPPPYEISQAPPARTLVS